MINPFKSIKEKYRNDFLYNKDLLVDIFHKSDAWALWLIGFSIGGLALFVGNLEKFTNRLTPETIHSIIVSLFISIIAGILFRYVYIWFYLIALKIYERVSADFSTENDNFPPFRPLRGNETFTELILLVQQYTNDDYKFLIAEFVKGDDIIRGNLYNMLRDLYSEQSVIYQESINRGFALLKEKYEIYFDKPFDRIELKDEKKLRGNNYHILKYLGGTLLVIYLLSFGYALFLFCFNLNLCIAK